MSSDTDLSDAETEAIRKAIEEEDAIYFGGRDRYKTDAEETNDHLREIEGRLEDISGQMDRLIALLGSIPVFAPPPVPVQAEPRRPMAAWRFVFCWVMVLAALFLIVTS